MRGNLFRKLLTYFLVVIVLSLTSVGMFIYSRSSRELDQQSIRHLSQIANNALYQTDLYLQSYDWSIASLISDKELKRFVDAPVLDGFDYYYYWSWIQSNDMKPVFIRNPEVVSIYVISYNENAIYAFSGGSDQPLSPKETKEQLVMLKQQTKNDGTLSAVNASIRPERKNKVITLARKFRGLTSSEYNGMLAIEIGSKELATLWGGIDLGEDGYLFIMDESGQILYHPNQQLLNSSVSEPLKQRIMQSSSEVFESKVDGKKRMFVSRKSPFSGWTLVTSMPLAELNKPVTNIRTTTIIVGVCTFILAVWLAYRFGRSITKPIQVLKTGMRQTEKGNWMTIPMDEPTDEIDELTVSYNRMVTRLSELVKQVYEAELKTRETQLERQEAEFQSLQLQINPHFLYNTLETIVCYAAIQDSKEITEIVKAMAQMLRYSISTGIEEITVATELKHVLNYMLILKHRTEKEFEIDVTIPPYLLTRKMVRLTLQPLIENAFQHAFPDGPEQHHFICINAEERDGLFFVTVEDNGVGIPEDKLAAVIERLRMNRLAGKDPDTDKAPGGIGLTNVHRRIQMIFGEQYGIEMESRVGYGTKIIMTMPGM